MTNTIYLDNNATTYIDPVVAQRMHELNQAGVANPASQHRPGRAALHLLEEAKSEILEWVDAPREGMNTAQVIMTSGGSEANNLAIFGIVAKRRGSIVVGSTDHPSVIEAARFAADQFGTECHILPVDENGGGDLQQLQHWLQAAAANDQPPIALVSIMLGNNETGVIQDISSICDLCRSYDVPVHSDIVQAIGKMPCSMQDLGLSAVTLTAHKIHGPVGVGALVIDPALPLEPMIIGGGQQLGLRAGTEAVVPAVGFATALNQICSALNRGEFDRVRQLRDEFESALAKSLDIQVIAHQADRLPHTANISFPGADRQALQMSLDMLGLACSTGSACSSGSGRPSGSLVAMGLPEEIIKGSLRFSLSRFTTQEEVERAVELIQQSIARSGLVN